MGNYSITFLPDNKTVAVGEFDTLLDAARKADVYVPAVCGGALSCGKCKLILRSGKVEQPTHSLLTQGEVEQGYILACVSRPSSDLVVEVPIVSRISEHQIVGVGAVAADEESAYQFEPLVEKVFLELPEPSLQDTLPDLERVARELRRAESSVELRLPIAELRDLPRLLRANKWRVTALVATDNSILEAAHLEPGDTSQRNFALAVDIGTTTIVAQLIDLMSGRHLDSEAAYNQQVKYGEDVISRIIYAEQGHGLAHLHQSVVDILNELITTLEKRQGIKPDEVTAVMASGNTTMMHLFYRIDPSHIRREPYIPAAHHYPPARAFEVGLSSIGNSAYVYSVPGVSSYVGGDIVAGALAAGIHTCPDDRVEMLIDVGTNGEIAVGNREWLMCCSASAGPAFEGGEVKHGMRATRGAIERVEIADNGKDVRYSTIGNEKPVGICGSGLLDLLAELLVAGVMDRRGKFIESDDLPRLRYTENGHEFIVAPAAETATGEDIVITQADINNLICSKAAVYAGAATILKQAGLTFKELGRIYISGGFGNYLNIERAIAIGLLPNIPPEHIRFIGNSSIAGARMTLLSRQAFRTASEVARKMAYLELSVEPTFMDEYIAALFLPHTHAEW